VSMASDRQVTPREGVRNILVLIPEMNVRQGAAQFRYCTSTMGTMEMGLVGEGLGQKRGGVREVQASMKQGVQEIFCPESAKLSNLTVPV
jgi:hypothetical protein